MNRYMLILVAIVILLSGCVAQEETPPVSVEPVVPPKPVETVAPPAPIAAPPVLQEPKLSQAELALGIEIVGKDESKEAISINGIDTRRISRDRGELRWINITLRNFEDKEVSPQITFWFKTTDYEKPGKVIIEQLIDAPRLAPMRKYAKRYPVTIYYDNINERKDIELSFHDLGVGPKKKLGETKFSFTPTEQFPTMEIHW